MNIIRRICFQDGPEDGRVLTRAMLNHLCGGAGKISDDISLYADLDEPPARRSMPVLLGRYRLGGVVNGTATYRWWSAG
jgi:hypothetical protein